MGKKNSHKNNGEEAPLTGEVLGQEELDRLEASGGGASDSGDDGGDAPRAESSELAARLTSALETIDALRAEMAADRDRYIRLMAEYDNYRKRSQKERDGLYIDVRIDTVTKILPVLDNLDRALAQETADLSYKKGVELTRKGFWEILEKCGIEEIPALGEKFNPDYHNAVMHVEDESVGSGIIVEEFEKGYCLSGRVLRFSAVKVAN